MTVKDSDWFGFSETTVFLEYKSVKNLPPQHFGKQFVNDLFNDEVTDLRQIQWRFDKNKVDDAYLQSKKADMLGEVENRLNGLSKSQLENLVGKVKDLKMPDGTATKSRIVDAIINELKKDSNFDQMMRVQ